ncbi:Rgg/GadR/MutR family transcriptional activator [Lactobacillus colini]|uniref:Rgg/GadR/MutR family transcriptional activator n=1 Tax=Lactobacillus colini TaxID=1819254 RepID=A0ABS4MF87_9LACO|nr:Rgg/GadR/MutR family transcriptional regulator [Lactobacillus colini]MBP2058319.1 Rgg/GadR/MutR family transcriptional activator [Lactobacillus colini]
MYGHEFKQLRQMQEITQKQACQGICSESKLSRWENDQTEIDFTTAIKLLERIHVTSHEFMGWSNFAPKPEINQDVWHALNSNDVPFIKRITKKQLKIYHQTKNKFDLFIAASLCNALYAIERKNYLPALDQKRLASNFSKVKIWSEYYLSLFGSCVLLLEPRMIYGLGMNIIHDLDHIKEANTTYDLQVALGGLGDAVIKLLFSHDFVRAKKLLKSIHQIDLPQYMTFFPLIFNFLEKTIIYLETNNPTPALTIINNLKEMNCLQAAKTCVNIFEDLSKAYKL